MPASPADERLLSYVTNLDRPVFALRELPEEVVAVLFAYYSRSRDDLRTNLRKLIDDQELALLGDARVSRPSLATAQEKARAFHEKWVVGYGHASVAEHGVVHLAVEGCSIVAAKALEEARIAAYTEKSTRYVRFGEDTLVTDIGLPAALAKTYEDSARASLAAYAKLLPDVESRLAERHPVPAGANPKAHQNALRAHALDLLRGLLPAGAPTNLGITINGRALEHHLSKLLGSPLAEVRALAALMRDEGRVVLPTLLKYTEPRAYRDGARARVDRVRGDASASTGAGTRRVTLLEAPENSLRKLAAAIECDLAEAPWSVAWERAGDPERARTIVEACFAERGQFDAPLRALEQLTFRFEVCCDYGAWRDLQRHRLVSASTPRLTAAEGYWVSDELAELGVGAEVRASLERAAEPWSTIAQSHPWEAQYAVPLAYRVRYSMQANLREVFHLVELRSARQGHESYRRVAIELADAVLSVCPWLAAHLRVDRNEYAFARH